MLEHFFARPHVIAQLQHGPLGPYLENLATLLHQQRYALSSIQSYLRAGHTFGRWLRRQGYALSDIDASVFQTLYRRTETVSFRPPPESCRRPQPSLDYSNTTAWCANGTPWALPPLSSSGWLSTMRTWSESWA
jgi:hypothetical protein